jgi:hypothetical protein
MLKVLKMHIYFPKSSGRRRQTSVQPGGRIHYLQIIRCTSNFKTITKFAAHINTLEAVPMYKSNDTK